jgi:hypothetical protein
MFLNILCWLYITLVCVAWGNMLLDTLLKKQSASLLQIEFPIICLSGLSVIGVIALYLSIFIALDWKAHLVIVLPALIYSFFPENRNKIKRQVILFFSGFSISSYTLLSGCILLVLVISSYTIKHPDTIAYHAQAILWMKNYKAIPGLVHVEPHLGFQSMWFGLQAVFCPVFNNLNTSFYVSGCVVSWYFIFVIGKINKPNKQITINGQTNANRVAWLLLLIFTFASWTQVRLTAASASPDFIVALYILAVVYTLINHSKHLPFDPGYLLLPVVFCCTAVAIKFSALAISFLLLPVIFKLLQKKQRWHAAAVLFIAMLITTPILIRNAISSGYLLYPSTFADFFNPDWKADRSVLVHIQHYITAYARFPVAGLDADKRVLLPFSQWMPGWWANLSIPDKLLITFIAIGLVINIIFLKSFFRKTKKDFAIFLLIFLGTLLWFIKAPDPRFGTGFLLCLSYFLYSPLYDRIQVKPVLPTEYLYKCVTACFFISLISYSCYRLIFFFRPREIVFPEGIEKVEYKEYDYGNIKMNLITKENNWCGATPVPCLYNCCDHFVLRGKTISEGFRKHD